MIDSSRHEKYKASPEMMIPANSHKSRSALFAIFSGILVSSCASNAISPLTSYNIGKEPAVGVPNEVSVGSIMYSEFDYLESKAAIILDSYEDRFALGRIRIPPNTVLNGYQSEAGEAQYCSTQMYYFDPLTGPYSIICFGEPIADEFHKIRATAISLGRWKDIPGVKFRPVSLNQNGVGSKLELVYQGISGTTITIAYREYQNDFARPAFSQIVMYDISGDEVTPIQFKGAKFNILEANNNTIRYIVERGFQ